MAGSNPLDPNELKQNSEYSNDPVAPYGGSSYSEFASDSRVDGDYAARFRKLLWLHNGQTQDDDGNYPGVVRPHITDEALVEHLSGRIAIAFCVSTRLQATGTYVARFLAFDVDKHAPERLPVFAIVARELGIGDAIFCTGGSSPDKAKIIITLKRLMPRRLVRALGGAIYTRTRELAPHLFPEKEALGDIEVYPRDPRSGRDGGLCRVLGRNVHRDGPLEIALDLDGQPRDLFQVQPLTLRKVERIAGKAAVAKLAEVTPDWVRDRLRDSWAGLDYKERAKRMASLAYATLKSDGDESAYDARLRQVMSANAGLRGSESDARNPIQRELNEHRIWATTKRKYKNVNALALAEDTRGKDAYDAIAAHVKAHGLDPHCFYAAYHTIAAGMGKAESTAVLHVDYLERDRRIVVLDFGRPNSEERVDGKRRVKNGKARRYGLVLEGETIYDAIGHAWRNDPAGAYRAAAVYASIDTVFASLKGEIELEALHYVA